MKITFTTTINVPKYVLDKLEKQGYKRYKGYWVRPTGGIGITERITITQDKRIRISYHENGEEYDCEYFTFKEFKRIS